MRKRRKQKIKEKKEESGDNKEKENTEKNTCYLQEAITNSIR